MPHGALRLARQSSLSSIHNSNVRDVLLRSSSSFSRSLSPRRQDLPFSRWRPLNQVRTAKTRTTVRVEDLPQGVLRRDPASAADSSSTRFQDEEAEGEAPAYPTVIQQARNNMRRFENCIVLTRVGSFYELYFEQAQKYGPLLNLKVAEKRTTAGAVPMAGFPFFQLDRFLKVLVQDLQKYVAVSEEFPNSAPGKVKSGGLLFDRRVTRVITPGTLVDEKFMDPFENNFLLAIDHIEGQQQSSKSKLEPHEVELGLAWLDLSTGEFFTERIPLSSLSSAVTRIGAKEIVMRHDIEATTKDSLLAVLDQNKYLVTWSASPQEAKSVEGWNSVLESPIRETEKTKFSTAEIASGSLLLGYVRERLQGVGMKLQPPVRRQDSENMAIDRHTMRGLEILETSRDGIAGGKGSLLHSVRRTVTKSGARLLRDRISSPSTSIPLINQRLDLVQAFIDEAGSKEEVVRLLQETFDSQRIVQKFSLGKGDADDLVSLHRTITAARDIREILESMEKKLAKVGREFYGESPLAALLDRLQIEEPMRLAAKIADAIDEDSLLAVHQTEEAESAAMIGMARKVLSAEGTRSDIEAMPQAIRSKSAGAKVSPVESSDEPGASTWIMRRTASPILRGLHDSLDSLKADRSALEASLKEKFNAPSLTLRWTPGHGHICHVRGTRDVRASFAASTSAASPSSSASTSRTTRTFYDAAWTDLGRRVDQLRLQIGAEEQRLFHHLRGEVVRLLVKLRRNAAALDELDVACGFARLARELRLVRPALDAGVAHRVVGGRHPTVVAGLEEEGRAFVGNDCFVGDDGSGGGEHIWLVTGPNMAGKSTFLRQNALLPLLAQAGSFVPAAHAALGVVDRLFARVGAADDLSRHRSTFMVEMLETAAILRGATRRSFVVMDEVGRGTTPRDGVAVGLAALHHLHRRVGCRVLFATHFHELADLTAAWGGVGCYCTDVVEEGEGGEDEGAFYYKYKLRKGVNRKSHALKVARLAGMPDEVVQVAKDVLKMLEDKEAEEKGPVRAEAADSSKLASYG